MLGSLRNSLAPCAKVIRPLRGRCRKKRVYWDRIGTPILLERGMNSLRGARNPTRSLNPHTFPSLSMHGFHFTRSSRASVLTARAHAPRKRKRPSGRRQHRLARASKMLAMHTSGAPPLKVSGMCVTLSEATAVWLWRSPPASNFSVRSREPAERESGASDGSACAWRVDLRCGIEC